MNNRLEAMNDVLLGCQECIQGKAKITASTSGRNSYALLRPLINNLVFQASELTESVKEVKRLATIVEERHASLVGVYMLHRKHDRTRIQTAEARSRGKLLDVRKAKIAMTYHKLDALETKLKAFDSDWKIRQAQFEQFEALLMVPVDKPVDEPTATDCNDSDEPLVPPTSPPSQHSLCDDSSSDQPTNTDCNDLDDPLIPSTSPPSQHASS
ncbi:hypothetical protein EV360DRAFT_83958 [Lentinula raphanica]|nr:hypothetical protein EV360DRAFT_83958 [Lentinula raphanica]